MKKINIFISFILLSFLSSCTIIKESSELSSSEYSSQDEIISSDDIKEESSSEKIEYQKDEEGFYILEDDYFKHEPIEDNKKKSYLRYVDDIPSEYQYKDMRLYAGGNIIPLFTCKTNYGHSWSPDSTLRLRNPVAIVELEGKMTFTLATNFAILDRCIIRPLNANVDYLIDNDRRIVTFTISSPGNYTIDFRSDMTLHLFVNKKGEFDEYRNDNNVIYFKKGIHNKNNNNYIDNNNTINLSSNTTVFVDYGAIIQAKFNAYNASNVKIVGGGIIDGSVFDRNATTGAVTVPYDFNYCNNVLFKGIATTDPAGWCYNLYFSSNITLDNIKIISSRQNGDGISLQSCHDITATNCFVRTWDDSLVVKNYPRWDNRNNEGSTYNILFDSCVVWTDLAQSMEIGYETIGEKMENIRFNNIVILHNFHKAPISIHNANNANLKEVYFTNITIEDAAMGKGDGNNILIDFSCAFSSTWSTNHKTTGLGSIDGVLVDNVKVIKASNPKISVVGSIDTRDNTTHYTNNVTIKDVLIEDVLVDENYNNLMTNQYVNNLIFESSGDEISGATLSYIDSSEYGTDFEINIF